MSEIDWDSIRVRYAQGETAYAISKSMDGKPSKVGIQKRANREDWFRVEKEVPEQIKNLPLLQSISNLPRKRTAENVNMLIEYLGQGASEAVAARAIGITPQTLYNWKKEDPEFARLCDIAKARKQAEWIRKIDQAKDWKAQLKLLQSSKETQEQFAVQRQRDEVKVILNIQRDDVHVKVPRVEDVEVIEGELDKKVVTKVTDHN